MIWWGWPLIATVALLLLALLGVLDWLYRALVRPFLPRRATDRFEQAAQRIADTGEQRFDNQTARVKGMWQGITGRNRDP